MTRSVFERVEIVFDATRVVDIVVSSSTEIARAAVVGASVQLDDVRAGASLCVALRSRALWPEGDHCGVVQRGDSRGQFPG